MRLGLSLSLTQPRSGGGAVAEREALAEWRPPVGAYNAYPFGARVSHLGQDWTNIGYQFNVQEPGVQGWVA